MTTIHAETSARLALIAQREPALRAFIRVDATDALASATAADQRRSNGTALSPLDGVMVAVKDNLAMAGVAWTAGVRGRRHLVADADASAVARLRAAGAILLGGTNMDEAALGAVTDNPTFGRCINPLGAGLTTGGSSGGSAAAIAAGFADLALGTDTMGSIRVPAAYCGIAGFKPTYGAVDRSGLAMLCPSLDTIGPLARQTRLLWPALQAIADPQARTRWADRPGAPDLAGLRFAVPSQVRSVQCQDAVWAGLTRTIDAIRALGGHVEEIDLSGWDPHGARRAGLLVIEAEGAAELADLMESADALSMNLRKLLAFGRDAPKEKVEAARDLIATAAKAATDAFANVDAILMPTSPQRAFAHGTPVPANQADLTALANFAGCPAAALPVAVPGDSLPSSIQILGPRWSDPAVLAWAELMAPKLA